MWQQLDGLIFSSIAVSYRMPRDQDFGPAAALAFRARMRVTIKNRPRKTDRTDALYGGASRAV
jgi:hypothetical protein